SSECTHSTSSFRDAPLGAGPESILPVMLFCDDVCRTNTGTGVMDSGIALRAPRNDGLLESPRRFPDLFVGEEDFPGVGRDILGLPSRERGGPAFHFHHPHLADAARAGDAQNLAGLVARQIRDHV